MYEKHNFVHCVHGSVLCYLQYKKWFFPYATYHN